jgi:hypothetical protein
LLCPHFFQVFIIKILFFFFLHFLFFFPSQARSGYDSSLQPEKSVGCFWEICKQTELWWQIITATAKVSTW